MERNNLDKIKRIVILGHTGFVGNNLFSYLQKKYPSINIIGISSKDADLTDIESCFAIRKYFDMNTVVIMCSGIKSNYSNTIESYSKNLSMTENICKIIFTNPVRKFIFFSSIAVYGVDTDNVKINEKTPIVADTYYGLSKIHSENLLTHEFLKLKDSSLIILRTPTIYGPGEKIIAPTPSGFLITYLNNNEVTLWGDGYELREFIFVDDLIKSIDLLIKSKFKGILNLSSGKGNSYNDSLNIISKLLGKKLSVKHKERTKEKVNKVYDTTLFKSFFPDFKFFLLENGLKKILEYELFRRSVCSLCKNNTVITKLSLGNQTVANGFVKRKSEIQKTFELSIGDCQYCGLIQLSKKAPLNEIIPKYNWISYNEPEKHLDDLALKIKNIQGMTSKSKIIGVSYKDDSLIKRLNNLGFTNAKTLDFADIAKDKDKKYDSDGVEYIQMLLSDRKITDKIIKKEGKFDIIIARHILEHAYNVNGFVNNLSSMLNPDGSIVIEVPDCTKIFERNNYALLWEEHLSYFTPFTFKNVFKNFSLEMIDFVSYHYPLENSLVGIGKKNRRNFGKVKENLLSDNLDKKRFEEFIVHFEEHKKAFQNYLTSLRNQNKKITLFGAGHFACGIINFFELGKFIDFVVDDNPNKKGLFMSGSKIPIYNSKSLIDEHVDICMLTVNPNKEEAIIDRNKDFVKSGGKFYSIFKDSNNSLPFINNNILESSKGIFKVTEDIVRINGEMLKLIKNAAFVNPLKRARICCHNNSNDRIHEMIIIIEKGSFIRPHRHNNKSESFHIIQGEMDVILFDEDGNISEIIEMGEYGTNKNFYYRLSKELFHMVIIRSDYALFQEVTNGPFKKEETIFAKWSPDENNEPEVALFLDKINNKIRDNEGEYRYGKRLL